MLKNKLLVAALASAFALPVLAEDAPAASPFSSNVSLTSNYLYRGLSQSGAKPALQGGFDYANSNGVYVGTWGSSISWISDAGAATNAGLELDTYAGYKGTAGAVSYDVGFLRYNYPGAYIAPFVKADTNEVYGALTYSIVTVKLSDSLGDTFGTANAKGSTYLEVNATYPVPDSTFTLAAHYGKQKFAGTGNDIYTYADYKLTVSKDLGTGYGVSLAFSNTDAGSAWTSPQGLKLGKSTAVLSLSRAM
jgi:uncharacterized protein (TIGR02001 family)